MSLIKTIARIMKRNKLLNPIYRLLLWIIIKFISKQRKQAIQKEGLNVLSKTIEAFDENALPYFIDFGTLLGFIREGTFIGHDLDIDIGIYNSSDSLKTKIQGIMKEIGFRKLRHYQLNGDIVEESYVLKGVSVDLFYYFSEGHRSYCYSFYKVPGKKYENDSLYSVLKNSYTLIDKVEYRTFHNIKMAVPYNPEAVLVEKYGVDWKTPDKSWGYWKAPSSKFIEGHGVETKF